MSSSSKTMLVQIYIMLALLAVSSSLCPGRCRCTKYISNCSISSQRDLPQGLDENTERLQIELYNIGEMNRTITSVLRLPNLKQMRLVKVGLNTIRTDSFAGLGTLESLTITNNNISLIETASFKSLKKLHKLDLSRNLISDLPAGVFQDLLQLRHLDLRGNRLTILRKIYFDGMRRNHFCNISKTNNILDLSYNLMESIESNTFEGLCAFTTINLKGNSLKYFGHNCFFGLTELKFLYVDKRTIKDYKGLNRDYKRPNVSINEMLNGLSKLEHLEFRNTQTNLKKNGFHGLESLTYLNLEWMNIEHLERGMFHGLGSVRTLKLSYNNIRSLGNKVFYGLQSLLNLDLSRCVIDTIRFDTFFYLIKLRFLDLSSNNIEILPAQVFSQLVSLRELRINGNKIHSVAPKSFSGLCSLKLLDAESQEITTLDPDMFSELARLESIKFKYSKASNTSIDIKLKNLQIIKTLDIHIHGATNVGSALEAKLEYVKFVQNLNLKVSGISLSHIGNMSKFNINHLDMSHNNFPILLGNYHFSLTTILSLDLSYCEIKEIEPTTNFTKGALNGLVNLQKLDLTWNRLLSLESGIFEGLSNLLYLPIRHSRIRVMKQGAFKGLNNLQELDLSGNKVTSLDGGVFKELAHIKTIDLTYNKIELLNGADLRGAEKLEELELENNLLSILSPGTFSKYNNLRKLDISTNNISSLTPGVFHGLNNIYEIDLSDNRLTSLSTGVFGAGCDQDFNITCESVRKLPHGPCNVTNALPTLQVLYLSKNNISYIHPHTFLYCNQLKKLYLSWNRLLTLDTNFLYIQSLERFEMNKCGLTEIPPNAFACTPNLSYIRLNGNNFSSLNSTLFTGLNYLQTVNLHFTYLNCDCDLKETWNLLHEKKVEFNFECEGHSTLMESEHFLSSLECNTSSPHIQEVEGHPSTMKDYLIFKQYIEPVILLIIFFCGLFGNGLLLYICLRYSDMRTATNVCVFNLAVSDLLSLIVNLPLSYWDVLHVRWELGLAMCQFFMMLKDLTVAVSVYSVVALALERYIVTLPRITHLPLCRIKTSVISLLWSFAISSSACAIWSARADIRCLYCPPDSVEYITRTWTIQLVVFCLIPATLIFILNGMTARNLYTSVRDRSAYIQEDQHSRGREKLANMVVTLVFVFLLSYLPSFLLRVLVAWSVVHMEDVFFYSFVTYCFFFFSCLFNPISLFIISPQFKSHLMELVHIVTRDEPEPESEPVPTSEKEIELQKIQKARMERLAKIGEKFR